MTKKTPPNDSSPSIEQHPDVVAFRAARKAVADNRAAAGAIDAKIRDVADDLRKLGRRRIVAAVLPGSREAAQVAKDAEISSLEKRKAELDAELPPLEHHRSEARGRASEAACEQMGPAVREAVRSLLRAGIQLDLRSRELAAILERVAADGFKLCGPLGRVPWLGHVGRADTPGPLSHCAGRSAGGGVYFARRGRLRLLGRRGPVRHGSATHVCRRRGRQPGKPVGTCQGGWPRTSPIPKSQPKIVTDRSVSSDPSGRAGRRRRR